MVNAHVGLSYVCNMHCNHCYVFEKCGKENFIDKEALLDKLESLGVFYITYTMGEVLLYKGFLDFAAEAKRRGFYQILLSNGSTIKNREQLDELYEAGIKKIAISIDSIDSKKHDANRNYQGAYELAKNALKILAEYAHIQPQLAMTIRDENIDEIPKVIEMFSKIGINSYSFLWLRCRGKISKIGNIEKYEEIMREIILMKEHNNLDINVHDCRMNRLIESMFRRGQISIDTKTEFLNMNRCHALDELILINPEGDMYICNFAQESFANIYDSPLGEIASYVVDMKNLCGGGTHDLC